MKSLESYRGQKLVGRYWPCSSVSADTSRSTNTNYRALLSSRARQWLIEVFLPEGYPASVSSDYLNYQIWDTVQAYASSITGALATQSVLQGIGVGDTNSTVLAATLTWLLKDGTGLLGRLWFAWRFSPSLDALCKQWRLFADVLNDTALCFELISPLVSAALFKVCVFASGAMRSIVGVAGGATRAALIQHQALRNNMADVSAKDGSQETLVNLAALVTSLFLLPLVPSGSSICGLVFILFTVIHVYANYKAVKSVAINSFNQPRFFLVLQHYFRSVDFGEYQHSHSILLKHKKSTDISFKANINARDFSVAAVNYWEPVFLGAVGEIQKTLLAGWTMHFGSSVEDILELENVDFVLRSIEPFQQENFAVMPIKRDKKIYVILRRQADSISQLKAILAAVIYAQLSPLTHSQESAGILPKRKPLTIDYEDNEMRLVLNFIGVLWDKLHSILLSNQWNLNTTHLQSGENRAMW